MVPRLEMGAEIHSLKTIRGRKQLMREPNINFGKIFQLHRPNFHQPTKYCYGIWNTFNFTFKVPSPKSFFKTQLKI